MVMKLKNYGFFIYLRVDKLKLKGAYFSIGPRKLSGIAVLTVKSIE